MPTPPVKPSSPLRRGGKGENGTSPSAALGRENSEPSADSPSPNRREHSDQSPNNPKRHSHRDSRKHSLHLAPGIVDDVGVDEDADGSKFTKALSKLLGDFHMHVLAEHEKEVRSLLAENTDLRKRLCSAEQIAHTPDVEWKDACEDPSWNTGNGNNEDRQSVELKTGHVRTPDVSKETPFGSSGTESSCDSARRSITNLLFEGPGRTIKSVVLHTHTNHQLENAHRTCFERVVLSHYFDLGCACVILANCVIIALEQQYRGIDNGKLIGAGKFKKSADQTWPYAEDVFLVFDIAFNTCFCLELTFRLAAMKGKAVCSAWIWFDTIIVALGLVDISSTVSGKDAPGIGLDPTMIRVVRLVKVMRLFKAFRAMDHFDSLFLLIKAIGASWIALVWSFLILGVVQVTVGLFLCQILQGYIENDDHDAKQRRDVFMYFGTFTRTMITMFEITLANWAPSCRLLVDNVSEWFIAFYIVYRCMFCFAVIRVIAAVFITETNRVLESDDELTVMKSSRAKKQYANKLRSLFRAIDLNQDGAFDFEELQEVIKHARTAQWLSTLHIDINDFEKIFWLLDDGMGRIYLEDFVLKAQQLKGQAKTIDISVMLQLCHRIDSRLKKSGFLAE